MKKLFLLIMLFISGYSFSQEAKENVNTTINNTYNSAVKQLNNVSKNEKHEQIAKRRQQQNSTSSNKSCVNSRVIRTNGSRYTNSTYSTNIRSNNINVIREIPVQTEIIIINY